MNWKNRLTNYNFWISLVSAVLLIMQAFNFEFDIANLSEIATALLGLLVVIGIISNPTKSNSQSKAEDTKQTNSNSNDQKQSAESNVLTGDTKESVDSMPSHKQNEDNSSACKDDFKVLIEKISSDIAVETGIMKENVANVVNEIIKTYEEGEFMLETENKEVENTIEEKIENEIGEQNIENNLEEIAEELIEKEEIEISEELAESVEEEYVEFKNLEIEEEFVDMIEPSIDDENISEEIILLNEITENEEVIEEIVSEPIEEEIKEEINQDTIEIQDELKEEVISFKIVN